MTVIAVKIVIGILAASMALVVIRLFKGPSLSDRVVALDLLTIFAVAMMAAYSILTGKSLYIFIGIVTALISFLSTLGFAYYVAKRGAE